MIFHINKKHETKQINRLIFKFQIGEEIKNAEYVVTNEEADLVIAKAAISDSGTYSCTLKNDLGHERVTIKVTVVDKPGQPIGPLEVSDVKPDSCSLKWKPPKVTFQIFFFHKKKDVILFDFSKSLIFFFKF